MIKKYLHTRFRVQDMGKSIDFYSRVLGLEMVQQKNSTRGSCLVFLQFPGSGGLLELCSFPTSGTVTVPEDLVHLAFQVENLEACMTKLKQEGIPITEGPTRSSSGNIFIFTEDPDKYEIELIEYADP
ncbi:MAG: VOC family protein [Nitrospinota bacterium]|nr:VOC family protein [Nitrospinota bacterium]